MEKLTALLEQWKVDYQKDKELTDYLVEEKGTSSVYISIRENIMALKHTHIDELESVINENSSN